MISTSVKRFYDPAFTVTEEYRESLPDLQNGPSSLIEGADVPIQQVGISNFRLPLRFPRPDGEIVTLDTSVDGYVGLDAGKKGINMSRIIRTFYDFRDEIFYPDKLEEVLRAYKRDLESSSGFLRLSFNYPMIQHSLRSGLEKGINITGWLLRVTLTSLIILENIFIWILNTAAHVHALMSLQSMPGTPGR